MKLMITILGLLLSVQASAFEVKFKTVSVKFDLDSATTRCFLEWYTSYRIQAEFDAVRAMSTAGLYSARTAINKMTYLLSKKVGSVDTALGATVSHLKCSGYNVYYKLTSASGTYRDLDVDWTKVKIEDVTLKQLKKASYVDAIFYGDVLFENPQDCEHQKDIVKHIFSHSSTTSLNSAICDSTNALRVEYQKYTYDDHPISKASYDAIQDLLQRKYEWLESNN